MNEGQNLSIRVERRRRLLFVDWDGDFPKAIREALGLRKGTVKLVDPSEGLWRG